MRESVLLAAMALSMIGCPYRGLGDSDVDLAGLEDRDMQCGDPIMLNFDIGNANMDMADNNQGNGVRCLLSTDGKVSWKDPTGPNATGSCQYVIGFNLGASKPCSQDQFHFITYDAFASWVGGTPVNVSGAAVRIFVRDASGKSLGSQSASLEMNKTKSQCIQLPDRVPSLGGIAALLVLTLDTSNSSADAGVPPLPSVGISKARLTKSPPDMGTCVSLDPL